MLKIPLCDSTPLFPLFFLFFSFLFSLEQVLVSIVEAALNRCINITNVLPAVETAANAFYLLYSELCSTLLFYRGFTLLRTIPDFAAN